MSPLILVTGAGGFIGGQLVKYLEQKGAQIRAVDRKPFDGWYFCSSSAENRVCDLQKLESCYQVVRGVDEVYNLASDMGGMGFIENNKALCMLSVLINTHLLAAARDNKVNRFFFSSSACVYPDYRQQGRRLRGLRNPTRIQPCQRTAANGKSCLV